MAVDSRQKRASATSLITIARVPGVDNTSLDQAQRQSSIWSYSGIAAGSPVVGGEERYGRHLIMIPGLGKSIMGGTYG